MDSAPEFTTPTEAEGETIRKYLEIETQYMAAAGFFTHSRNALIRSHAVSIIATNSPKVNPDAFIPYLAMNYFDRYFSTNQFQDVQDVRSDSEKVCLIALSCLFISTKMRLKTLSVDQFLWDKSLNFTQKRIMELELKILDVLNWQMRPVTAFLYLNYYYRFFKSLGGFKRRCINEIIVQAQGENQFVYYKPSQIAMSAFLVAAKIAYPSNKIHFQEEELSECVRALGDLCGRMNIKIEPQVNSQEVEDEHSSEEVEYETELPIRQTRDKEKELVLAHEAGTAEQIASVTDEIGNKTHPEEGSLESNIVEGTELLIRCRGDPSNDELLTILIEKNDKKTHSAEGLLEWEQKVIEEDIVKITEEEKQRLTKGKAVMVYETSDEEERRLAKGKAAMVYETSDEEKRRLAKGKAVMVYETSDEEERSLAKGKAVMVYETSDEEEQRLEERRLAKGKAVMVYETSDEEEQRLEERRLAKGKAVAMSETSDEERQSPKSKLEEQKEILDKEQQDILVAIEAAIKLAIGMRKVDKGAQVGGSSELQIVNESEKLMNFNLNWVTDVPLLESGEPQTVIVQTRPVEVRGNANSKVCCGHCSIH